MLFEIAIAAGEGEGLEHVAIGNAFAVRFQDPDAVGEVFGFIHPIVHGNGGCPREDRNIRASLIGELDFSHHPPEPFFLLPANGWSRGFGKPEGFIRPTILGVQDEFVEGRQGRVAVMVEADDRDQSAAAAEFRIAQT